MPRESATHALCKKAKHALAKHGSVVLVIVQGGQSLPIKSPVGDKELEAKINRMEQIAATCADEVCVL